MKVPVNEKDILPTEINKEEICKIANIQLTKLNKILRLKEYDFPPGTRTDNREVVFDRAQFMEWLSTNDIKKMRVRAMVKPHSPISTDFNIMARQFIQMLDSAKQNTPETLT